MKTNRLLVLFLFILNQSFAQPDYDLKYRLRDFNEIQDSILRYPNTQLYKWVRADILFRPNIELQTKSTDSMYDFLLNQSGDYPLYVTDSIAVGAQLEMSSSKFYYKRYNPASALGDFLLENYKTLITDLTELIENETEIEHGFMMTIGQFTARANMASFLFKRGQIYYATGSKEKALSDYLKALKNKPIGDLEQKIYLAIAACYYNTENNKKKENYIEAMRYISLIEPALEDSSFSKGNEPTYYALESEKLELMKRYEDSTAYVNYLQNRSASYLNWYYTILTNGENDAQSIRKSEIAQTNTHRYELLIYEYLKDFNDWLNPNELIKHKKIIINKL